MVFLHIAAPWSIAVFCIVKKIDTRTSSSLRCLLGGRRRWGSMPKAVEPTARGSFSRWARWCRWLASLQGYLPSLDHSSALLPIHFCAAPPGRYLFFLYGSIDYCWCVLPCGLNLSTVALTLAPFLERSPSLMVHFVGVYFTPNDASGSPPLGAASLGSFATA